VQAEEREVAGIEQVRHRVAVGVNQRRFLRAIARVRFGRREVAHGNVAELFTDRATGVLRRANVGGDPVEPGTVFRGVLDPQQPSQDQQHARPFLLNAVGPEPAGRVFLHHQTNA